MYITFIIAPNTISHTFILFSSTNKKKDRKNHLFQCLESQFFSASLVFKNWITRDSSSFYSLNLFTFTQVGQPFLQPLPLMLQSFPSILICILTLKMQLLSFTPPLYLCSCSVFLHASWYSGRTAFHCNSVNPSLCPPHTLLHPLDSFLPLDPSRSF